MTRPFLVLALLAACTTPTTVRTVDGPLTGEVLVTTPHGETVRGWVDHDGLAIAELDIVLGRTEDLLDGRRSAVHLGDPWPDLTLSYSFDPAISADLRDSVIDALADWEDRVTGLTFVRDGGGDGLHFVHAEGLCASPVGYQPGGTTEVLVSPICDDGRGLAHEIGHALGFLHEHSRTDRDDYITVNETCIDPTLVHAFTTWDLAGDDGRNVGPFDTDSVMIYASSAGRWSIDGPANRVSMDGPDQMVWIHDLLSDSETSLWTAGTVVWSPPCGGADARLLAPLEWSADQPYMRLEADPFGQVAACGALDLDPASYRVVASKACDTMTRLDGTTWGVVPGVTNPGDTSGFYDLYGHLLDDGLGEAEDAYGSAAVAGDFDGDGLLDLAVGAPGEDGGAGAVYLHKGHYVMRKALGDYPAALAPWGRLNTHPAGEAGAALAAGDLDHDGITDLVVGIPGDRDERGAIEVFFGSPFGLSRDDSVVLDLTLAPSLYDQPGERLGAALAVGDFDDDGRDDLVAGVPGAEATFLAEATGQVVVFHDLVPTYGLGPHAGFGVAGAAGEATFGHSLAVGDFDGDGDDDLAIGAPNDAAVGPAGRDLTQRPGGVYLAYQHGGVLHGGGHRGGRDPYDCFGQALAAGDIDGDGHDDLVVGAPCVNGAHPDTGEVTRFSGTPAGPEAVGLVLTQVPFRTVSGDGLPEAYDRFGMALVLDDLDADGRADLVVGATGESDGMGVGDPSGAAYVYESVGGVLTPAEVVFSTALSAAGPTMAGGSALVVAHVSNTTHAQVVFGAPEADGVGGRVGVFSGFGSSGAALVQELSQ